jgi:3-deoxy-manno-octulosonate cytidylyltransferase (CMP-KDO synthetase)
MMTSSRHRTGSDRTWEVVKKVGGEIVVNIQADNFGLKHTILDRVIQRLVRERTIRVATLVQRVKDDEELFDPNLVKVLVSNSDQAIWFSRYPLPYIQRPDSRPRSDQFRFYGHIGVYFFRRAALEQFARSSRTMHEKAESLEQLRLLENGERIRVFKTRVRIISVDGTNDVDKLVALYN